MLGRSLSFPDLPSDHKWVQLIEDKNITFSSGLFPHVNTAYIIFIIKLLLYNLTTLCLNGTLPCVYFIDVIIGDIPPKYPHMQNGYSPMLNRLYNLTTLCLNETLPCVEFIDVIMGDIPFSLSSSVNCACHSLVTLRTGRVVVVAVLVVVVVVVLVVVVVVECGFLQGPLHDDLIPLALR